MNHIIVIVDEEGKFVSAWADSEIIFAVLKQGRDDAAIDVTEQELTEIEV